MPVAAGAMVTLADGSVVPAAEVPPEARHARRRARLRRTASSKKGDPGALQKKSCEKSKTRALPCHWW